MADLATEDSQDHGRRRQGKQRRGRDEWTRGMDGEA